MPRHTPSPHRFLAPAPPTANKPRAKPPSGLRHATSAQTPKPTAIASRTPFDEAVEPKRVTPAKRFVFSTPASRTTPNVKDARRTAEQVHDAFTPSQTTPRPKVRLKKAESIDNTSPSSSANVETQDGFDIMQGIEHTPMFGEDEGGANDNEEDEILFVAKERNKRRRVSIEAPVFQPHDYSEPEPSTPHPQSSPQLASPVSHRFKVPTARPNPFENVSTPASERHLGSRPHFILPQASLSPTKVAVPLPEIFSPSRKIGKYVANGMAATLQSWIHEAASTGYSANNNSAVVWGRDKEDGVQMKIRVASATGGRGGSEAEVECWPGGVVFVRGTTDLGLTPSDATHDNYTETRIMLAGQGGVRGKGGVRVGAGRIVGVRAPIWDVHVGTGEKMEKWLVAVEWIIL